MGWLFLQQNQNINSIYSYTVSGKYVACIFLFAWLLMETLDSAEPNSVFVVADDCVTTYDMEQLWCCFWSKIPRFCFFFFFYIIPEKPFSRRRELGLLVLFINDYCIHQPNNDAVIR